MSKLRQRLSLDINISTKYVYVKKHKHNKNQKATEIMFCECNGSGSVQTVSLKLDGFNGFRNTFRYILDISNEKKLYFIIVFRQRFYSVYMLTANT